MVVAEGQKVKVHYKGTLADGTVFDSSENKEPLEFVVGSGQVISGFNNGVLDMNIGDKKRVEIPCAEAYGEYLEDLNREYPLEVLDGAQVQAGQTVFMQSNDGRQFPCLIKEIDAENIYVDFNHPLAGKDLIFDIELVAVS